MEKITSLKKSAIQVFLEFFILAIILIAVAYFAYSKIDSMLKESLEESVALTSRSIAVGLNNQFEEKFMKLNAMAHNLEIGTISTENIDELFLFQTEGEKIGILTKNNDAVFGEALPENIFSRFEKIFNGEKFVMYYKDIGLIFAMPLKLNNQNYLIYNSISSETVRKTFNAVSYNGAGTVILLNSYEDWMVIDDGEELINTEPEMQPNWQAIMKKIEQNPDENSWSIYGKYKGKSYFLYVAEFSKEYNFAISGYVSWEKAAVGIDYIYQGMFITLFFVLMCLIFGARYIFIEKQARLLEREKLRADSANQAKSAFLSNMSHEIRTPINAIMGMNEMVIRESTDPAILEYSENLQNAARTLLGLVNDILDFSKIEAGKMEIIPVEYQISSVLNDLVNMIETRAEKKGLQFIVEANPNMPDVLYGDEIRIKQVVTNILTNAVKYTEKGSVTLKVDYEKISDENISLKISVSDTGIGIKPEDMKKLYSAFERIEEKRNRTIEGTGLGMNITKQLLTLMKSKLEVESVYGEGSTFSFKLTQKVINDKPIGDFQESYRQSLQQRQQYRKTFTAPNAKILIVDDTVMNLTVVKGLLKQTKIQIDTAESGFKCLELVTKTKYDIIFLDHRMPKMDGIETLQEMKKLPDNLNKETPVISLTANAISGAREEYISAGFKDYLTKPIDSVKLEEMIVKYLPADKIEAAVEDFEPVEENLNLPEWLQKIEDLNLKDGVTHCGDVDAYLNALKVFVTSIKGGADEIEGYFNAGDLKNYTTKVHALKSSARVIGANELSDRALKLEDAGNAIQNDTAPLLELYRSYIEKLSPLIEVKENNADKQTIDADSLIEAYETMKEAAANFDIDTIEVVLQSLEEYNLQGKDALNYNQLKEAASKLDWAYIKFLLNERK